MIVIIIILSIVIIGFISLRLWENSSNSSCSVQTIQGSGSYSSQSVSGNGNCSLIEQSGDKTTLILNDKKIILLSKNNKLKITINDKMVYQE